ncbi:MAG: site-2 protease family protein [Phycisphaerae bacterium]|nr:site-2 protease family protein [Phycisphaerae bacterium]
MDLKTALFLLPGLIIGLTVHEAAHAISAKCLGDRTSEKMGRISLNPMRHLSIYGTLALFFLGFGWGKPVIVNLYNFKKPKFYYLLSSLAGPASNLLICGVCLGVLYMHPPQIVFNALIPIFLINGMLAAINLVPVPPLDGSKIWPCLIPGMKPTISGKWSMIWIVVLIVGLQTGGIGKILRPIQDGMWWLLPDYSHSSPYHSDRPENFPQELIAPPNVTDVVYTDKKPTKGQISIDCYSMTFPVQDDKHGETAYVSVGQRLKQFGWRRLKYILDDPEIENNGQLIQSPEIESVTRSQSVNDFWFKSTGEMIWTSRRHMTFKDEKLEDLNVVSAMYLDNISDNFYDDIIAYKTIHPEEFEGIQIAENIAKPEE